MTTRTENTLSHPPRGCFSTMSLIYLIVPYLLFFFGFLRWYAALVSLAVLCVGAYCAVRNISSARPRIDFPLSHSTILTLFCVGVVAFLLLLISGVGGYGYQDEDWMKHQAILGALIEHPWPVSYSVLVEHASEFAVAQLPLIYYIAYYLPAALVGKLFGWFWANQALFLWTYAGLCLAMLWFMVLVQRFRLVLVLFFVGFSGLDVLGLAVVRKLLLQQPLHLSLWTHIERWSGNWQYPANVTSIFWVPNQAIPGWIMGGLLFYTLLYTRHRRSVIFLLSLTLLWSPFLTLGFLPYVMVDVLRDKHSFSRSFTKYLSVSNLCGLGIALVCVVFYASRFYEIPLPLHPIDNGLIFTHPIVSNLVWYETLGLLGLFVLLECGLYAWLLYKSRMPLHDRERALLLTSFAVLAVLPFFRYGFWNDLVMRASIPALFVVCIFVARALYRPLLKKWVLICLIVTCLCGALNAVIEVKRHLDKISQRGAISELLPPRALYDAPNVNVNPSFFTQYIGSAESPFFLWLAKPLQVTDVLTPTELLPPQ